MLRSRLQAQTLGGTGGDAGSCAVVPNMYYGVPFTDKWSFGIGINAPFGLETEYDSDWLGRFQAIKSKIETINVNPVLSWEPTKNFTVGAGVSWQKLKAELTKNANYTALVANKRRRSGATSCRGPRPRSSGRRRAFNPASRSRGTTTAGAGMRACCGK